MKIFRIGLIREGKIPQDSRVALTPAQCKWLLAQRSDIAFAIQPSATRCYKNEEYERMGIPLTEDLSDCDILLGIKEVPVKDLITNKTYLFFSHTKKKQPHNQKLLQTILEKKITLIDYECLEHEDGQRIIGFGFFAGIVGAHNGLMAYGNRTGLFHLDRVYKQKDYRNLIHTYFGLRLPNLKIAVTGSGRVAQGLLEVMNLVGVHEVEPDEYLARRFNYPVYTQLKSMDLYERKDNGKYNRQDFHETPGSYKNKFMPYTRQTDILLNGVYWSEGVPRLFEPEAISDDRFIIETIADVADDENGSVPINKRTQTIEDPVYGVDRYTLEITAPYLKSSIDIMAVGNLPNELPRDASRYFGEQLIKFVFDDLLGKGSETLQRATIAENGKLGKHFSYLADYAAQKPEQS
ncbi:alanine dehydrogenase [Niabella ginsenosidivorans]|uniref:Alanine dehydrogenase n=1 Tax=Niabella ginsenosidivorans TaxID=1176587 RepID=A0A1A9HXW8_9BACT|nr:NAD(P)-dependent oxidoreductase [Niabella ginsenosidivorans]ANH80093.1 alanine dehydrogenase [Niabella ginsenosidivorans]